MPDGKEGNGPAGLCHTLCFVSQKHLLHSCIRFMLDGESLYVCGVGILSSSSLPRLNNKPGDNKYH